MTTVTVTASILCTLANWLTSPICQAPPDLSTLVITPTEMHGQLTSGIPFSQVEIAPGLQKFTMQEVFWYIDEGGQFYADSDLQALSIHLAI